MMLQKPGQVIPEIPDILSAIPEPLAEFIPSTPSKAQAKAGSSGDNFYDDESVADSSLNNAYSSSEKEKQRIGELWLQELVEEGNWARAGQICEKVLNTPDRWEKWVWTFAGAKKFNEIADHIPSEPAVPPLPTRKVYDRQSH